MQAKSIDFYGPWEIDERMWAQNVDADELPGQVDYNTWQGHESRFTTFDPPREEIGKTREKKKIRWSKWRDKSESETLLIMEAG